MEKTLNIVTVELDKAGNIFIYDQTELSESASVVATWWNSESEAYISLDDEQELYDLTEWKDELSSYYCNLINWKAVEKNGSFKFEFDISEHS